MLVIPAIDLKEGKCVRLKQGRMDDDTVFSDDPVGMAGHWYDQGARRLHIVDLDGAISGKPEHSEVIHQICQKYPDMDIQIGGGIRNEETIQAYLDQGVKQVIIGTRAVQEPQWIAEIAEKFPNTIIVGLDAKDGYLATHGWVDVASTKAIDLAKEFTNLPIYGIVYTDIARDGMLTGVNVEMTKAMADAVKKPVIASGGIASMDDIKNLIATHDENSEIFGAITGRAIYTGSLDFKEAIEATS